MAKQIGNFPNGSPQYDIDRRITIHQSHASRLRFNCDLTVGYITIPIEGNESVSQNLSLTDFLSLADRMSALAADLRAKLAEQHHWSKLDGLETR